MINWVIAGGKTREGRADVEIGYSRGRQPKYTIRFSNGAHAVKLKNAERISIGLDANITRVYFAPCDNKTGFKFTRKQNYVLVQPTEKTIQNVCPTLSPATLVGSYQLKYDDKERCYYISIGALPR